MKVELLDGSLDCSWKPESMPLMLKSSIWRSLLLSVPVREAMCFSISSRAFSTLSGRPVTSNTGSLSRPGVTMYVEVVC
mgnify:CR=1 FL=1